MRLTEIEFRRAVALVRDLRRPDLHDDEEMDRIVVELQRLIVDPAVTDLAFHHEPELSDEEVVRKALAYRPIAL